MNEDQAISTILSALTGTAQKFYEIRAANADAARGQPARPKERSTAARQLAEQGNFSALGDEPVQDCLSIADLRLIAAADHLESCARLLEGDPQVFGIAATARAAMECSVRAAWALDPSIDARERVIRGLIDRTVSIIEASRLPIAQVQTQMEERLQEALDEASELGWEVRRNRHGNLLSIAGVKVPSITGLVTQDLGPRAGLAYRYLSAVAHGVLWGLMRMSVVMETPFGGAVKPQTHLLNVVAFAGEAVAQFFRGFNAQVRLYGWDMDEWRSWTVEAGRAIHRLALEQAEGPG